MKHSGQKGFTTVEIALVLMIMGMVSSAFMFALTSYNEHLKREHTKEALTISEAALAEFKGNNGRMPCPADPTLGPGDLGYGVENCGTAQIGIGRDADQDGIPDQIVIGAVPIMTLLDPDGDPLTNDGIQDVPLTDKLTLDGWGNKLTYAVSRNLTNFSTYSDYYGAIDVVSEDNDTVLNMPYTSHSVLVAHGENGRGAYTLNGNMVEQCVITITEPPNDLGDMIDWLKDGGGDADFRGDETGYYEGYGHEGGGGGHGFGKTKGFGGPPPPPPPITVADETENCDGDGTFMSGLYSEADSQYNDDSALYLQSASVGLWQYVGFQQISNTNPGNVGMGIQDPVEKLHVDGDIKAFEVRAELYCDETQNDCMPATVLGGDDPNMECGDNEAIVAVEGNAVVCAEAFAPQVSVTCPVGERMYGISSLTGPLCAAF